MMSRKYVLIPILVTLVVLVISLYPTANVTQRASAAPRAAVVTKYLMIPAAGFTPITEYMQYMNTGRGLELTSGVGYFYAPVYLPRGARIRMIRLFAYDSNQEHDLCARLFSFQPQTFTQAQIKEVCTLEASGNQKPIGYLNHDFKWYFGYYVELLYPSSTNLSTSAVMIKYTINQ
jgi:hypothetical protein